MDNEVISDRVTRSSATLAPRKSIEDDNSNSSDDPSEHLYEVWSSCNDCFVFYTVHKDFKPKSKVVLTLKINRVHPLLMWNIHGSKHLRMLQFRNPGKFMEDFDPETSAREMRKMNRRIYRENRRKNQAYDESGILMENSQDLCDCLDVRCPGCHFPCPKCGSEKCGTECRCNRKWVYEYVEVEGTNMILKWPDSLYKQS